MQFLPLPCPDVYARETADCGHIAPETPWTLHSMVECAQNKEVRVSVLAVVLGVPTIAALVGFVCYLAFLVFVVLSTGNTAGLRDVAVAMRAFGSIASLNRRPQKRP